MSIYKDRIRSLEEAFIYYLDCQVATLWGLLLKKSSSMSSINRQLSICQGMEERMKQFCTGPELQVHVQAVQKRLDEAVTELNQRKQ